MKCEQQFHKKCIEDSCTKNKKRSKKQVEIPILIYVINFKFVKQALATTNKLTTYERTKP